MTWKTRFTRIYDIRPSVSAFYPNPCKWSETEMKPNVAEIKGVLQGKNARVICVYFAGPFIVSRRDFMVMM